MSHDAPLYPGHVGFRQLRRHTSLWTLPLRECDLVVVRQRVLGETREQALTWVQSRIESGWFEVMYSGAMV